MSVILINGELQEQVSVLDRGFQYGDGLFETLKVIEGTAQYWRRHFRRLKKGCERLSLMLPEQGLLEEEIERVCAGVEEGVLKVILTRGGGQRGYAVSDEVQVTRVLSVSSAPQYPLSHQQEGIVLMVCQTPLGLNPALAGIKHLNRLEQVLARTEFKDPAISEGLMLDTDGYVIEGTMSNVFCARKGILFTPDLSRCGVEGIMRERVLEAAAKAGNKVVVAPLSLDDILQADEVFMCNSLMGIWPVRQLEDKSWLPGRLTKELIEVLEC